MTTPSRFAVIALDQLGRMAVLEDLDSEEILAARMTRLVELWRERDPPAGAVYDVQGLEFDPIVINQETSTYFELLLRDRVNHVARAVTTAFATGSDLDAIASRYPGGMPRLAGESDDRYRRRIWLSPNGLSPHGSAEAYVLWALSADATLRDASAVTVSGTGVIDITILPETESMEPTLEQLLAVRVYLNDASRKGLTDVVNVRRPKIVNTRYDIDVWFYPGPDTKQLLEVLQTKLEALVESQRWLGFDHTLTAIQGVMAVPRVHHVEIKEPAADLIMAPTSVVRVTDIVLTYRGRTE